jgi:hypothetical protein
MEEAVLGETLAPAGCRHPHRIDVGKLDEHQRGETQSAGQIPVEIPTEPDEVRGEDWHGEQSSSEPDGDLAAMIEQRPPPARRTLHHQVIGRVESQSDRREPVGDQVDPEDLSGQKRVTYRTEDEEPEEHDERKAGA